MDRKQIKEWALANGFKLKTQPDGSHDLNPYVYQFAEEVIKNARRYESTLEQQVKRLQEHPDSYQSGFDDGCKSAQVHVNRWKEWARHQVKSAVPDGHCVVPQSISDDVISKLGLSEGGNQPFFVINDKDDVRALYAAMVSLSDKNKNKDEKP